jgi:20S proteasome alpha/beta subunit
MILVSPLYNTDMTLIAGIVVDNYVIIGSDGISISSRNNKVANNKFQKIYELDHDLFFGCAANGIESDDVSEFARFCRNKIGDSALYSMGSIANSIAELINHFFSDRDKNLCLQFMVGGFGSGIKPEIHTIQWHNKKYTIKKQPIGRISMLGKTDILLPMAEENLPDSKKEIVKLIKCTVAAASNVFPDEIGGIGRTVVIKKNYHMQEILNIDNYR